VERILERESQPSLELDGPDTESDATPAADREPTSYHYSDTWLGRMRRVYDILEPPLDEPGEDPPRELVIAWQELEAGENRHTVKGETDAFELLYPAIVAAARRQAGRMTFAQFIDPKAVAEGRA